MNKLQKTIKYGAAIATLLTIAPLGAWAQSDVVDINTVDPKFDTIKDLRPSGFVSTAINLLLGAAGIVAFFFLLIGGIQWILAGGDKEGTEKARKKITNALIGLAIVFSAYALIFIIQALFGIELLRLELNPIPGGTQTSTQ